MHEYILFNSMRNINIPRPIGIPTPMSHARLCWCLSQNWEKIQDHYKKKTLNQKWIVSRIHIRKQQGNDSLFEMNYKNWRDDGTPEPDLTIGKKYIVSVDISHCYPSIYSHVISWALVGMQVAKQYKGGDKWYNEIDKCTRNCKNGETLGLLIGPHTSNILSEIILCSIDEQLCSKWDYIRNIDDFSCFVKSRDEADAFLIDINRELQNFRLSINHKKTEIRELPISSVENWVHQIKDKALYFEKFQPYVDYNEVQSFIDFCVVLANKNKENASIFNYAFKVLSKHKLTANAQVLLVKQAVSLSLIYPYIVPLLGEYVFKLNSIEPRLIEKYVNCIYETYMPKNYFEACTYALFYAVESNLKISSFNAKEIVVKGDCLLSLLALIYCRSHEDVGEIKILEGYAKNLINSGYMDQQWLFIYECLDASSLKNDWNLFKKEDISFLQKKYR